MLFAEYNGSILPKSKRESTSVLQSKYAIDDVQVEESRPLNPQIYSQAQSAIFTVISFINK